MRAVLFILLTTAVLSSAQKRTVSDAEVQKVHRAALLIDTHNDFPTEQAGKDRPVGSAIDVVKSPMNHTDLTRLREGGVGAVFFAAYVAGNYGLGERAYTRAGQVIDIIRRDIVERYPDDFVLATTAAQIEAAHKQGKIAALIGIEGGHAIQDSLDKLREFYGKGVRYMTLTHSNTNNWADSSGDQKNATMRHHSGLTDFGKDVVREMNRLGMMVDISHVADKTFFDTMEVSKAPLIASHSSSRALANVPRNLTDEMIIALAKKGGVVQVNFYCEFLTTATPPRATTKDVVEHIDHIRKIAGIGAVGIGSDFDGIDCVPVGLEDVSKFPSLTRALLERGYSAEDVRKIYGGNFLRVMRAVEKVAAAK
ncbi:MAG: membrane dipeptidase [Bryobacterales bacterium]|nr:membrane dipeptidase [Bryobacterales bacterium]